MPGSNGAGPNVLAVIPARYASTRFPGKVLAPLEGKPLVVHVYERTRRAGLVSETLVATDDERVREAAEAFGARVEMTRADHASGTDRIAEVARRHEAADIVVNVQGDEPFIEPAVVDAVVAPLLADPAVPMATARCALTDAAMLTDPNVVKVVCSLAGRALYFSRAPIPHERDGGPRPGAGLYGQHIGLYAYRRDFLLEYASWPPTPLELAEKLEQLRALEHGAPIAVVEVAYTGFGVDSPADFERAKQRLAGS